MHFYLIHASHIHFPFHPPWCDFRNKFGEEYKIYPATLHKYFCFSTTIRSPGVSEIKHWTYSDKIFELFQCSASHIAFQRNETKTCTVLLSHSARPLMVYSEQVKRRRSANEDTLQYLYSFTENIDTLIVISVLVACLCRSFFVTFALTAGRCFPASSYPRQPPMGPAIQVNMISLLPHTRPGKRTTAPFSFARTHVNYSELNNGANQVHDYTPHRRWQQQVCFKGEEYNGFRVWNIEIWANIATYTFWLDFYYSEF